MSCIRLCSVLLVCKILERGHQLQVFFFVCLVLCTYCYFCCVKKCASLRLWKKRNPYVRTTTQTLEPMEKYDPRNEISLYEHICKNTSLSSHGPVYCFFSPLETIGGCYLNLRQAKPDVGQVYIEWRLLSRVKLPGPQANGFWHAEIHCVMNKKSDPNGARLLTADSGK